MTTKIKQYKVGDEVWYARYDKIGVKKPCPVCYGEKEVTLILGNKEQVKIPCDYCGKGWDEPRGYVTVYEYVAKAQHLIITGIESKQGSIGEEIRYYSGGRYFSNGDLFDTETEAQARCTEKAQEAEREEWATAERLKKNHYKSYAWNAGYHLREANDCRKQAEYHEKKARLCKERAK